MALPVMDGLIAAVIEGNCQEAISQTERLRAGGCALRDIVTQGIERAMTALDTKCTLEDFNLLEIMLAGRAVMSVMNLLYPSGCAAGSKGTVVIATLEGDVHDLGKNILKIVLTAKGYRVVDCGKDCSLQRLMEAVEKEQPFAVGISGLITPVIPQVRSVRDHLVRRGLARIRIVAGGAALKQSSPRGLNVDYVAESAFDALHFLDNCSGAVHHE